MSSNRLYDMVFLIVPEKDEQGVLAVIDEFRKLLVEGGAAIEKDESMGRRRLAYSIKRKTEATYHNFLFRADSKCVSEVQRKMRLSEDVLRFLTVRIDEELKHGQKVARNTKVRTPRRVEPAEAAPTSPIAQAAPAAPAAPAIQAGEKAAE